MPRIIDISKYQKAESEKPKAESAKPVAIVRKPLPTATRQLPTSPERTKAQLLAQLDEQMLDIRRDRNKVSNRARERWKAGADEIELAALYVTIESHTEQLQKLWDKRTHVEKFGSLPLEQKAESVKPKEESAAVALMKLEKKKLEEKKSKLRKKLTPSAKEPKNPLRKILWQQELDKVEAHWQELDQKIKQLQRHAGSTE